MSVNLRWQYITMDRLWVSFFAYIAVNDLVIVELKAARTIRTEHEAQLLNYLNATSYEVGLLLNFGPKPQVKRKVFDNDRKKYRSQMNVTKRQSK